MDRFFKNLTKQQKELGLYALLIMVLAFAACLVLWATGPFWNTLLNLVGSVLEPLAYGFMLSYALNPIVIYISHALRGFESLKEAGGKRRAIAVLITALLVVMVLLGLLVGFAVMLANGISSIDLSSLKSIIASASEDITGFLKTVKEVLASWGLISEDTEGTVLAAFANVGSFASTALFSVMFTVYFLLDGDRLFGYFHRVMFNVLGEHAGIGSILLDDADRVFSGYFRGQATDAVIVALLSSVALSLVRGPYEPVIGLLTGLGNLIPYVGGPVAYTSIIVICLAKQAWYPMLAGIITMSVVMFIDGNIINPRLLSDNVEVHPMLVVAALIAGGAVGGIAGMLVAVPTAAWLKIQLDRWMEANEARKLSQLEQSLQSEETDQK